MLKRWWYTDPAYIDVLFGILLLLIIERIANFRDTSPPNTSWWVIMNNIGVDVPIFVAIILLFVLLWLRAKSRRADSEQFQSDLKAAVKDALRENRLENLSQKLGLSNEAKPNERRKSE